MEYTKTTAISNRLAELIHALPGRTRNRQRSSRGGLIEVWSSDRRYCVTAQYYISREGEVSVTLYDGDAEDVDVVSHKLYEGSHRTDHLSADHIAEMSVAPLRHLTADMVV